jgi:hypothetical protein
MEQDHGEDPPLFTIRYQDVDLGKSLDQTVHDAQGIE